MVDLVVADALDQQYTQANGGKVSFNFKHTLSRISFKAKLGSGDFTGMDGNTASYTSRICGLWAKTMHDSRKR